MQTDFRLPMADCAYQVFLSFRGPDTRHNFIKYFNEQLRDSGIVPFLDSKEIEDGDRIDKKIVEAIKRSSICVPVFSEDFATSPACLMEVAQMVESKKRICPIFFGVKPCVVRYQRGTYKESFAKHKQKNRYTESIEKWKTALTEVGHIWGPEIKNDFSGCYQIKHFIFRLWRLLRMDDQDVPKSIVGIDDYVPEMMRKLGFDYKDGRVIKERAKTRRWVFTVWGPPGIGKTTLAWVVYKKIGHFFEGCSFLENVRDEIKQNRLVFLQNRLIRDLKREGICPIVESSYQGTTMIPHLFKESRVLIVLDDVDDFKQIESLAELTWFGLRSRIILTTKNKNVYKVQKSEEQDGFIEEHHEILPMKDNHALELFSNRAFQKNHPPEDYDIISRDIISAVENLPFAIDFLGRYLHRESEDKWTRTFHELKVKLHGKVGIMLEANYEFLSNEAKEVFLDIACFFTEVERTIPCYMWAARGLHSGVDELQEKSFLKIGEKNELSMHGQLKFLGREIVKKENLDNPGERSRLWDCEDVQTILLDKKVTNKVKALRVASHFNKIDGEKFHHLSNLRFLELDKVDIEGSPENLLPNLVWLDWRGCPKKSKLLAFKMEKLVILNLCSSPVQLTLDDWKQLMEKARSLEVLNLKDCNWINASLKFPASSHLRCLILEGCLYLKSNQTISNFENLVSLNMKHCRRVKHLPQALCSMKELEELLIDGTEIRKLQFEENSLPALKILSVCKCEVLCEVTDSIGFLKELRKLNLRSCNQLNTLPLVFGKLVFLQEMDLSFTQINQLPPCVKDCKKLQVLKMVRTYLEEFPEAIKDLKELKELDFTHCGSLSGCCNITGLFSLRILRLKGTAISQVFARDEGQFCLHILELDQDVTKQTQTSQKKSRASKHKRKREQTQTSQEKSRVSKHKRKRDEE